MNTIITTERLLLSTFTEADAQLIYELNADPAVTKFTLDPVRDLAQAAEILNNTILPQYHLYKHGRWAIHLRSTQDFIGWCGLKNRPERNEIDLGYRLLKQYWGNGYATEAAQACIQYGFELLGMKQIVGRAMPDNIASIQVLKKCGMSYVGDEIVDAHPAKTYQILNPASV